MDPQTKGQMDKEIKSIPPTEDLMREHGILKRVLLIYRDIIKRLEGAKPFNPLLVTPILFDSANLIRNFIEDYHQELENQYIFPEFIKHNEKVGMVRVLQEQHNVGRKITSLILQSTAKPISYDFRERLYLAHLLSEYIRMYEPHEAREDTVLFPAFRELVSPKVFYELGEKFEEIEEKKFGKNGFKKIADQVAYLEIPLGIHELAQFTPKI